jgi:predicted permease
VKSVEISDLPPLSGGGDQDMGAMPVGMPPVPGRPTSIWFRSVTPGYFAAMRVKIVAGRGFTADDRAGAAPVAIVNEEAARRFWPNVNPIGRLLATSDAPDARAMTIVGIAASVHHDGPNQPYKNELYLPIDQVPSRGITLILEPSRDVASLAAAVRQALHDVDPLIPVRALDPMTQIVGETTSLPRLYATLVGLFAAAALLLAALGVYGVMAYAVAQRQREIGVRLALGAEPSGIRRMILGEGGRLALLGVVIGLGAATLTGQLIGRLLFGVSAYDAPTFVAVPLVLGVVTVVAAWIPARRAMRLDPLSAIREE